MGLAEKRAAAEFKDKQYPAMKAKVDEAIGFPVEMEVAWDTLPREGMGGELGSYVNKVFFTPLTDALKAIATDDMGKKALKDGVKKIVIAGSSDYGSKGFSFSGGVLTLKHDTMTNVAYGNERKDAIQKLLEDNL